MNIFSKVIVILIFVLAGILFLQNLTSINVDIGRHIKLGEIIWQTKNVPDTNLFSFTAPDHPFINHHWLSEVIFSKIYSVFGKGFDWASGLKAIIIFKATVLLATYFLLFLIVRKHNIFSVVFAFLVSIFVFSARTEPRPEIFSYLIFSAYLLIIYRIKEVKETKGIFAKMPFVWMLPILQLLWVNLHIYFIIGPVIFLFFLVDRAVNVKINHKQYQHSNGLSPKSFEVENWKLFGICKLEFVIFALIMLANLANPNFITGALYPLKVLGNYGYSVAENSSLFFLAKYFGHWAPQDRLFVISLFVLAASFILSFCKNKLTMLNIVNSNDVQHRNWLQTRVFNLLLMAMTVSLAFKMQRNIPLFALSLWPILSENLSKSFNLPALPAGRQFSVYNLKKLLYFTTTFILIVSIYLVISGQFYNWLDSAKKFGWGVSSAAQDGTDFVKAHKIQGPVFNNFDIGSYLVWQLYPDQKVFVDGRPEAYPVEFFNNIYKPMQRDEKVWKEMSEKYGIYYIFFAHTDMTEWADEFLTRIGKDKEWPMVFLNDAVVVFLKNNDANKLIINNYEITEENINERVSSVLAKLNKNDDNAFINFGNALSRFRLLDASAKVFETLIVNQPKNPYGYQGAGSAYAIMNDPATQEKAGQNLGKAIDLGFKTFNNYFTLGIINANRGNFFDAEENIKKALKINPDNKNAQQVLKTIRAKLYPQ